MSQQLKELSNNKSLMIGLLLGMSATLVAQSPNPTGEMPHNHPTVTTDHTASANNHQEKPFTRSSPVLDSDHANKFAKLLFQDQHGRMKPVQTYALEALRKVHKKDSYNGQSAVQVLLSAQLDPGYWARQPIVKVRPNALGTALNIELQEKDGFVSIYNCYKGNEYILAKKVEEAQGKAKFDRNATDNEIINLDERINVWWSMLQGSMMNIYPKKNEPNNKWFTGVDNKVFTEQDTMVTKMHELYMSSLVAATNSKNYTDAEKYLDIISQYQTTVGADIIPSPERVNLEIKYNNWDLFKTLVYYYMILGFFFLIFAFIDLFKPNTKIVQVLLKIFSALTILGMIAHLGGLGARWYISGHEPWSNGYEAVIFVAFVTTLAGLIFSYKKSKFTLAATVLFASFLLGIAHGSMMNPEITNLVPVLKSYWLMIHVAVITASYGFLGLSALLGFIVLVLYILRNKSNHIRIEGTINELSLISESSMTVGLYALSLGTFLGGVWANESWGRYWSWDPKEVWSLISMMIYIFVLHMRLVPGLKGRFTFNLVSMFSIATLIMTFFGVNYYLSGMHSYAAGDPVPIPMWLYYMIVFFVVFANVAYWRYSVFEEGKKK